MRNEKVRFIAEVGVLSALGLVLDFVAGLYSAPFWSQGGSISIAMVVIFIMGYRWGLKGGLITGFIVGTIQMLWGTVYGFGQAMLDYVLAYTVLGLVGIASSFIKNNIGFKRVLAIIIPIVVVAILRTAFHVLSGMIYFDATFGFSLTYNGLFMLISTPICILVTVFLVCGYKGFFINNNLRVSKQEEVK